MHRFPFLLLALSAANAAMAQQSTGIVTTTMVRTGWDLDSFAVVTSAPIVNPANCPSADGYISEKSMPGYQTYLAASLAAFSLNAPVDITVHKSKCFAGRPVMIGINLRR